METLLKQDIFFFITTIAVIVIAIMLAIAIYYGIKILRDVRFIAGKAKQEAENLSQDINDLRENVKHEGVKIKHIASFIGGIYNRHKERKNNHHNKK